MGSFTVFPLRNAPYAPYGISYSRVLCPQNTGEILKGVVVHPAVLQPMLCGLQVGIWTMESKRDGLPPVGNTRGAAAPRSGGENDALLGWGRGRGNTLTGMSGQRGTAKYTEGPLGGITRSRMASYDSAVMLGLPR